MQLLGLEEAILFGELASEYEYWRGQDKLDDGWFYSTVENVEENTTLTKYKQKKAFDNLQGMGLLEIQRKGLPAKKYIKINEEKLYEILSNKKSKNQTSGSQEILPLEVKKFALNNNKEKEINYNKISKNENKKERNGEKLENKKQDTENLYLENKTSKKEAPLENQKSFNELIELYTPNKKLQEELKEHLKVRKAKKALSYHAIKLSLERLNEIAINDEEKIKIVQNSIVGGWTKFYELKPDEKKRLGNKPSYDLEDYEDFDIFS